MGEVDDSSCRAGGARTLVDAGSIAAENGGRSSGCLGFPTPRLRPISPQRLNDSQSSSRRFPRVCSSFFARGGSKIAHFSYYHVDASENGCRTRHPRSNDALPIPTTSALQRLIWKWATPVASRSKCRPREGESEEKSAALLTRGAAAMLA
ncbi:hypothetical protein HPB51_015169 [Rhipicephalus microplus]|uniref:Uncharacterized protein n=1 Tax=Rhipicephalus microplus TaxID=6941 RepID=A0A9J6DNU1_RHIMP|nr:hypothetical protein HPB51_015169 [Rhipicephalus microplus]